MMFSRHIQATHLILPAMLLFLFTISCATLGGSGDAGIERITPAAARAKLVVGEALMVCSYNDARCRDMLIEGALRKSEFEEKLASLDKDQEIIFYCA